MIAPVKRQSWVGDLTCIAILVSVALAIGLPRYRAGIDWQDEGFLAYGAVRVLEGQVPNRDFVSLQPPLCFYFVAALFKSLGTSLGSLRVLGLLIHVLIPVLIYAVGRNLMGPVLSVAAALPAMLIAMPYLGFVPLAVWQGITASLVAAALYIPAALTQRRSLAFVAGIVTALSIFLRQDQGCYFALSIVILTIGLRSAGIRAGLNAVFGRWLAGVGLVAATFAIFWQIEKALPEMFRQLVLFPLTTYTKTSSRPFPQFNTQSPASQNAMTSLYYILPLLAGLAALRIGWVIMRARFSRQEAVLTFLTAWLALFYCLVLTRSDTVHLLISTPPFFLLATYGWGIALTGFCATRFAKISSSLIAVAITISFFYTIRPIILPDVTKMNEALDLPRGGVRIQNGAFHTHFVRRLQNYVPPDRSMLALPYEPMFYFLCERRNPTRWNYLWPGDQTPDDQAAFVRQVMSDPPAVILLNNEKQVTYVPPIVDYIRGEYRHVQDVSSLSIYVPANQEP